MGLLNIINNQSARDLPEALRLALESGLHQRAIVLSFLAHIRDGYLSSSVFPPGIQERAKGTLDRIYKEIKNDFCGESCLERNNFEFVGKATASTVQLLNLWGKELSYLRSLLEKIGSWLIKPTKEASNNTPMNFILPEETKSELLLYKDLNQQVLMLEILLKKTKPEAIPPILVIDPTNHCNFRCRHCHQSNTQDFLHANISQSSLTKLAPMLKGVQQAKLFGTGEATLAPLLGEIIELSSRNMCRTEVQTNGSSIGKSLLNLKKIDLLGVSFDGDNKRTFESLRVGSNFNNLVKQIKNLKIENESLSIYFAMTVSRANIDEISGVVEWAGRLGVKRVFLNKIIAYIDRLKPLALRPSDKDLLNMQVEQATQIAEKYGIELHNCITVDHEIEDNQKLRKEEVLSYVEQMSVVKAYRFTEPSVILQQLEKIDLTDFCSERINSAGLEIVPSQPARADSQSFQNYRAETLQKRYENLLEELKDISPGEISIPYCTSPWVKFFVEAHSGVRPCDPWGTDITSLNTAKNFTEAWHSPELTALRRSTVGLEPMHPKCQGCTFAEKHLYVDELLVVLKQHGIDLARIQLPQILNSVSMMKNAHQLPAPRGDNAHECLEKLKLLRREHPGSFPLTVAVTYLLDCLKIQETYRFEIRHELLNIFFETNEIERAWEQALMIIEDKDVPFHWNVRARYRMVDRLLHLGRCSDARRCLLPLFVLMPSLDIAAMFHRLGMIEERTSGVKPSIPLPVSSDEFFEYALAVCRENLTHQQREGLVDIPMMTANDRAQHQLGSIPAIDLPPIKTKSLNIEHYSPESVDQLREAPAIAVYKLENGAVCSSGHKFTIFSEYDRVLSSASSELTRPLRAGDEYLWLAGKSALIADGTPPENYCHWMLDCLPRIYYHKRIFAEPIDNWIVGSVDRPFQLASLQALGIEPARVISLKQHKKIRAENLICCSDSGYSIRHPARGAWCEGLNLLKADLMTRLNVCQRKPHRRLFISRNDSTNRKIFNEELLFKQLEQQFGFECYNFSELSFCDQVILFSEAEAVIGAHGAGLTNILFCQPGAAIIEIFNPSYGTAAYVQLAHAIQLKYAYICGRSAIDGSQIPANSHRPDFGNMDFMIGEQEHGPILKHLERALVRKKIPARKLPDAPTHNKIAPDSAARKPTKIQFTAEGLCRYDHLTGSLVEEDLKTLFALARDFPSDGKYIEIGTSTSVGLVITALQLNSGPNSDAQLYYISGERASQNNISKSTLMPISQVLSECQDAEVDHLITVLKHSADAACALFLDKSVDLIVIDQSIRCDIKPWLEKLTDSGRLYLVNCADSARNDVAFKPELELPVGYTSRGFKHQKLVEIIPDSCLVSVLLPTKNRANLCIKSINSCIDSLNDKTCVEFLCYFDRNDQSLIEVEDYFKKDPRVKCFVFNTSGYRMLYKGLSQLCREARGKWLFLWNDDALMKSPGWDLVLRSYKERLCLVSPLVENYTEYKGTLFPIIPRKWFELTGCFSNQTHNDTWLEEIALKADIFLKEDRIVTYHDRFSETGENHDQTYGQREYASDEFYQPYFVKQRQEQADVLISYLKWLAEIDRPLVREPDTHGEVER